MQFAAPRLITWAEFEKILSVIPDIVPPEYVLYYENLLLCGTDAGLRLYETLRLKVGDLDLHDIHYPEITIRQQKNKRQGEVHVPTRFLAQRLQQHIGFYKEQIEKHEGYIFFSLELTNTHIHLSPTGVHNFFDRLRTSTGIIDVYKDDCYRQHRLTYHALRHFYCRRLSSGRTAQPIYRVQQMMRHMHPLSTYAYQHYGTQDKHEIVKSLNQDNQEALIQQLLSEVLKEIRSLKGGNEKNI